MAKSQTPEETHNTREVEGMMDKFLDAEIKWVDIENGLGKYMLASQVIEQARKVFTEYQESLHHQLQKAQENTIKEVIEIIESVQLVATKKHKNDTTPEKAKIINDWLMPEVKRNIIEAVKTLHRPKLDQDTVTTIAKEQLKENLDLIKRVGNG